MGYQFGINICREALCILSTNQEFEERTSRGFSEMNVILKNTSKKLKVNLKNTCLLKIYQYHEQESWKVMIELLICKNV
jgi:hypothetical protein